MQGARWGPGGTVVYQNPFEHFVAAFHAIKNFGLQRSIYVWK